MIFLYFRTVSKSFDERDRFLSYLRDSMADRRFDCVSVADLSNKKSGVYKENREKRKDDIHPAEVEGRELVTPTLVRRAESALYLDRRR